MTLDWEEKDLESLGLFLSAPDAEAQFAQLVEFLTPVIRSLYMTEAFLSLNAAEDGAEFFRRQADAATTDAERFASLVCLSQLLLASQANAEYAEVVTNQLVPLLGRVAEPRFFTVREGGSGQPEWSRLVQQSVMAIGGGLATLPMASSEFTSQFPEERLRDWLADWEVRREEIRSDEMRLGADLVMRALLVSLGDERQAEVHRRIVESPLPIARSEDGTPLDIDELIQRVRSSATATGLLH